MLVSDMNMCQLYSVQSFWADDFYFFIFYKLAFPLPCQQIKSRGLDKMTHLVEYY